MGKPKTYLIKSINFGRRGELPRELLEEHFRTHGENDFSEFMRRLVVCALSKNQETIEFKKKLLILETKEIVSQIVNLTQKRKNNTELLKELGMNEDAIYQILYD